MTPEELDAYLQREREAQAVVAQQLSDRLSRTASKETIYESAGSPRVLLRIFQGDNRPYFCVVEVDGTAPYRSLTAEERKVGMLSLNPPAAHARSPQQLVDVASRALEAAIFATPGVGFDEKYAASTGRLHALIGAGDLAMIHYRTARAIRQALRLLKEDI